MEQPEYAPLPWIGKIDLNTGHIWVESSDQGIQWVDSTGEASTAAMHYAVHCVNTHAALLTACRAALAYIDQANAARLLEACEQAIDALWRTEDQPTRQALRKATHAAKTDTPESAITAMLAEAIRDGGGL